MARDRSLDEFASTESRDDSGDAAENRDKGENRDPAAGAEDSDPSDPATSTYAFAPDGAACADCGAVVERRWRDDAGLVCADCKAW